MAQLAFSLDRGAEDVLLPGALQAGHAVVARVQTAGELSAVLAAHDVELAVVSASRTRLTKEVPAAAAATGARLVVIAATDDERAVAQAAGAPEIVRGPSSWAELEAALSSRAVPEASGRLAHETARAASVIAVWGPTGAPGRTSLAIQLAAELAERGSAVALIDADSYGGAVAPWLGLLDEAPGFAAACRLAGNDALTRGEFERIAQYVPTRRGALAVLTGLGRPSRWPEIGSERVSRTVAAVAGWFEHVVVDVGFNLETDEEIASDLFAPRRNAATLAVLEAATRLVAVGTGDPVGLSRLLRAMPEARQAAPGARLSLIVNRVRASAVGASPAAQLAGAVERFGGIRAAALIPDDPAAFDAAMLGAGPLATTAPRSPAREAIRDFVTREILQLRPEPERRRRASHSRGRPSQGPIAGATTTLDWQRVDAQ